MLPRLSCGDAITGNAVQLLAQDRNVPLAQPGQGCAHAVGLPAGGLLQVGEFSSLGPLQQLQDSFQLAARAPAWRSSCIGFAVGFPFYGAFIMLENVHSGVGLNTPIMVVNIIQSWLLQALPILILVEVFDMPATVIWWLFSFSGLASAMGMYWYYRRGRWLTVKV